MASEEKELTHDDIWDDSMLVDSWNQALDEYKKYHSIHARGGKIDDIPDLPSTLRNAKPETNMATDSQEAGDETLTGTQAPDASQQHNAPTENGVEGSVDAQASQASAPPAVAPPPPHVPLGSVRDEGLKKLLMSWYYAGYYTGLYEGQQKQGPQQPR